ncbi:MAG TPA: GSCFA domain-containing protein [Bacteroidales bacterium]|nr:GSCFA domain-containing protein [Bacteroidales bacterium]
MNFRTTFNIPVSPDKISYSDPVMFIGSCFSTFIGDKFSSGYMPVMVNPSGTLYNPASVARTIERLLSQRHYELNDLNEYNGKWISFDHSTAFSSENANEVLRSVNDSLEKAVGFISEARFLFITFGTARIFRLKETGQIVTNCHKLPSRYFTRQMMTVEDIVVMWNSVLDLLKATYPSLKIVFTISPVRHWKDGAHGNQVSKSVLFLAVEDLLVHSVKPTYFPSYELVMDDLRDYRYYDDDMLHPSSRAIDYIWEKFSSVYFTGSTKEIWAEMDGISKAVLHRIKNGTAEEQKKFAETLISKIDSAVKRIPSVDLSVERKYFLELLR